MYTIDYTPYKFLDWALDWDNKDILNSSLEDLSRNPNAIHILEQNLDKINWDNLSTNKNAIHLLEQNLDKISVYHLPDNPAIFVIDYQVLQQRIEPFKEELIQKCFHPDRLVHYLEVYNYDIGDDEYQD